MLTYNRKPNHKPYQLPQKINMMKKFTFTCLAFFCLLLSCTTISFSQTALNDNGGTHTVSYNGTYQEFIVPNNPNIYSMMVLPCIFSRLFH